MKAILIATLLTLPSMAMADDVFGVWKTQKGDSGGSAEVTLKACGDKVCGVISKIYKGTDSTVADPTGKTMIKNMKANGNGSYSGGTIWAPDSDKTYNSKMTLNGNKLVVKGCVAGGLICKGQTWTRVN